MSNLLRVGNVLQVQRVQREYNVSNVVQVGSDLTYNANNASL